MSNKLLTEQHLLTIQEFLRRFYKTSFVRDVHEIIVYGSCARGDYKSDSDIDILMVMDEPDKAKNPEIRQFRAESLYMGPGFIEVDLHYSYNNAWREADSAYFRNIKKDGIVLWTPNLI